MSKKRPNAHKTKQKRTTAKATLLADKYDVDPRTARRWIAEGIPSDDDDQRTWLASRRRTVLEPGHQSKVTLDDPSFGNEAQGAAPALTRAGAMESTLFRELKKSMAKGDMLRSKLLFANWVKSVEVVGKLDRQIDEARRGSENLMPLKKLTDAFRRLLHGSIITLTRHGFDVGVDAVLAGIMPMLASDDDRWLRDVIEQELWLLLAQSENIIPQQQALYAECCQAIRAGSIRPELQAIIDAALEKIATLPPVLPTDEYNEQQFQKILDRHRKDHPEEYAP